MDFYQLQKQSLILETIQGAKNLLVKDYAEKNDKNPKDIPDEIKKTIWKDPKFQQVLDLCKDPSQHNWVYPLTKFYIIDGADWSVIKKGRRSEDLPGIYDLLVELKQFLKDLPLKTVEAYSKIEPTTADERPGYEVLGDDLRQIRAQRLLKKMFDMMVGRMKAEFREISASKDPKDQELIQKLLTSSEIMDTLKPRKAWDDRKKEWFMEDPWRTFGDRQSKYSDKDLAIQTNPHFKDPKVAFRALVTDVENQVSAWGDTLFEVYDKLEKEGPKSRIFYFEDNYLAMSARTPETQKIVSGDSNFCINSASTFFSYSDGAIQVNILNFNLPKANPKSLLGVTINKDGSVKNCAYRPNSGEYRDFHQRGINYVEFLKKEGYPEELVMSIVKDFEEETLIKQSVENFYKKFKDLNKRGIVSEIMTIKGNLLTNQMSEEEWQKISGIVTFLVKEEKNISPKDFLEEFKSGGIMDEKGWQTFDFVVGNEYTKSDMEEIKKSTVEIYDQIKYSLDHPRFLSAYSEDQVKRLKAINSEKEENLAKMDSYIDLK